MDWCKDRSLNLRTIYPNYLEEGANTPHNLYVIKQNALTLTVQIASNIYWVCDDRLYAVHAIKRYMLAAYA